MFALRSGFNRDCALTLEPLTCETEIRDVDKPDPALFSEDGQERLRTELAGDLSSFDSLLSFRSIEPLEFSIKKIRRARRKRRKAREK